MFITAIEIDFAGGRRGVTLHYNAGGALQWRRVFGERPDESEAPTGLAVDAAGNACVSGVLRDKNFQLIMTTVKYGPTGDELWAARFQESGFSGVSFGTFVQGTHVDGAGRVIVVGSIGDRRRDVVAVAYAPLASPDAPVVFRQPQDVVVPFGGLAQFSVVASNARRFQWRFNGQDLPGATNATLTISAADWTHEGYYAVRVEDATYCIVSTVARLTLNVPAPIIASQGFSDEGYFYCFAVVTPGLLLLGLSLAPSRSRAAVHTGVGDTSTAVALDADFMFTGDDETQILRLYSRRFNGPPLWQQDFTASLGLTDRDNTACCAKSISKPPRASATASTGWAATAIAATARRPAKCARTATASSPRTSSARAPMPVWFTWAATITSRAT